MKAKIASFKVLIFIVFPLFVACSRQGIIKVTIVETTDVHGVILPYDFIDRTGFNASLAGVATYLKKVRQEKNPVILLDDGDNLQGQPEEYYYNFIDTVSPHFNSEVMNCLSYDAGTIGNHDIEAGHSVYDRIRREYKFPLLAANAVVIKTGEPYFEPYKIIKKSGLKIAIFG
jgi:2',3'-cyclic-nucleotide 2'-phosphodiesterase/3'-nucleotidase